MHTLKWKIRKFAQLLLSSKARRRALSGPSMEERCDAFRFLLGLDPVPAALSVPDPMPASLQIHWIISEPREGLGGFSTIFRLAKELSTLGHRNVFHCVFPSLMKDSEDLRASLRQWFALDGCEVYVSSPGDIRGIRGDVCIATEYRTAYFAATVSGVWRRLYLVQDFEPLFFPVGTQYLLAEGSYKLPLTPVAASKWLAGRLQEYYPEPVSWFSLGVQHTTYRRAEGGHENKPRIAFYLREHTHRRCAELGWLAFELLARRLPGLEVHCFGQPSTRLDAQFKCVQHGVLSPAQLASLYQKVRVGVVFSPTNHSLIPAEMMACGLPVVELDTQTLGMDFPDASLTKAPPHPVSIAVALERLLRSEETWTQQQSAGYAHARCLTWESSVRSLLGAITLR